MELSSRDDLLTPMVESPATRREEEADFYISGPVTKQSLKAPVRRQHADAAVGCQDPLKMHMTLRSYTDNAVR